MGATGALELVATILALRNAVAPPTAHLWEPDPECDLDYVPLEARPLARAEVAMSNSFGFGGNNAVLVVRRYRN
jgi:3-oxoacyl-[acyl-carrier-protein] synthase II